MFAQPPTVSKIGGGGALKMIDRPLVEVKRIKETARKSIFHSVLNWVQHQRLLLALVNTPIIHQRSEPNRKNTSPVMNNTDMPLDTTWYYLPHSANGNSLMNTARKQHNYRLMTQGWNSQANNLDRT